MEYTSTRDATKKVGGAEAIVKGLSSDGGLFVPVKLPQIDYKSLKGKKYAETAFYVLSGLLPEYNETFMKETLDTVYNGAFSGKAGELVKLSDNLYSLELWHGPTSAFKDYALQLLPRLLPEGKKITGDTKETLVLVATSGDTGTAALSGFCDVEGVRIICFYPQDGTSEIQRLQMVTQQGKNVDVYAVQGNFDDAQRGVKQAFSDAALGEKLAQKGVELSSANSINWGRLVPQIVYYFTSYVQLAESGRIGWGDAVDYCVPTGNFGDIMAGYYAKQLGLPVGRLICASNQNNVLADFLHTGRYTTKRDFYKTSSPSMDILVSSNLERLLYHESGNAEKVRGWMEQLGTNGEYTVGEEVLSAIQATFDAGWAGEERVSAEIENLFHTYGYLCDPHTAVAFCVAKEKQNDNVQVVLSTASPYKFSGKVLAALGEKVPADEFEALRKLENVSRQAVPVNLAALRGRHVRFDKVIGRDEVAHIPGEV